MGVRGNSMSKQRINAICQTVACDGKRIRKRRLADGSKSTLLR